MTVLGSKLEIEYKFHISLLIYCTFLIFYYILPMEHNHQSHQEHQKKHFSEEETLDKVGKKIDEKMEKIMNTGFIHKFLALKFVKTILWSHFVDDINHKISPYLKIVFTVVWWISLVAWIIWIFSFLVSLSWLGFMFNLWVGLGIRVLIYVILALIFSLLSLLIGIGMIRFKKRAISLIVLVFIVSVILFVVSLLPVGLYSYRSYGNFWSGLFNLIITAVLLILVLKNDHMFKH